tara:strand:- start:104774 stop:106252 length:1479 start_codon:yes stop_codon:yes gene_type:complete
MGYFTSKEKEANSVDSTILKKNTSVLTGENSHTEKTNQLQLMADQSDRVQNFQQSNNSGLPEPIRKGTESLSGHSMNDVNVHYNSSEPQKVNAHAFAKGNDIHLASGQEQHLPHEAWHVVQQKQGRVKPTSEVNGTMINDSESLESEADSMAQKIVAEGKNSATTATDEKEALTPEAEISQRVAQPMAFQQPDLSVDDSGAETEAPVEEPEPVVEEPVQDEEKEEEEEQDSEEFIEREGVIAGTGISYTAKYEYDNKKGEIEFEGPNEIFGGSAEIKEKGEEYEISAKATVTALSTPEFKGSMPLARIPLGIPGVFAAVDLDYEAGASLGGELGFKFNLDHGLSNPNGFEISDSKITAGAEAKIGVFGGVAAGLPGVAEVKVGGAGSAEASLEAEVGVDSDLNMSGTIEGEAKGKLEAVAEAKLLWYTKSASIPIVEGTLGKFEKEFGPVPLSLGGLTGLTSISSYKFTRDKGDQGSAQSKATDNAKSDSEE